MQNNKYYLERLSLPFLMAAIFGLLHVLIPLLYKGDTSDFHSGFWIKAMYGSFHVLFYIALGYITKNWPAAIAAMLVAIVLQTLGYFIFSKGYSVIQFIYYILILILSGLVFLYLLNKKLLQGSSLFIASVLMLISGMSYLNTPIVVGGGSNSQSVRFLFFMLETQSVWYYVAVFLGLSLPFFLKTLFFAEIINYANDKALGFKPSLLNLENKYPFAASLGVLIVLNIGLLFCFAKGFEIVRFNFFVNNPPEYFPRKEFTGFYGSAINHSLFIIPFLLLYGWYYRKFLVEYFIDYGQSSKLLYWFCFIPVIGIIFLLAAVDSSSRNKTYTEKQRALSNFASSGSINVAIILGVLLLLRGLLRVNNSPIELFASLLSILFLYLMTISKGFWLFCLWLNILLLTGIIGYSFFYTAPEENPLNILFGYIAVNTVSLMMLFPVFHIESFEYIPDSDPAANTGEASGDLFPEYTPFT